MRQMIKKDNDDFIMAGQVLGIIPTSRKKFKKLHFWEPYV